MTLRQRQLCSQYKRSANGGPWVALTRDHVFDVRMTDEPIELAVFADDNPASTILAGPLPARGMLFKDADENDDNPYTGRHCRQYPRNSGRSIHSTQDIDWEIVRTEPGKFYKAEAIVPGDKVKPLLSLYRWNSGSPTGEVNLEAALPLASASVANPVLYWVSDQPAGSNGLRGYAVRTADNSGQPCLQGPTNPYCATSHYYGLQVTENPTPPMVEDIWVSNIQLIPNPNPLPAECSSSVPPYLPYPCRLGTMKYTISWSTAKVYPTSAVTYTLTQRRQGESDVGYAFVVGTNPTSVSVQRDWYQSTANCTADDPRCNLEILVSTCIGYNCSSPKSVVVRMPH